MRSLQIAGFSHDFFISYALGLSDHKIHSSLFYQRGILEKKALPFGKEDL